MGSKQPRIIQSRLGGHGEDERAQLDVEYVCPECLSIQSFSAWDTLLYVDNFDPTNSIRVKCKECGARFQAKLVLSLVRHPDEAQDTSVADSLREALRRDPKTREAGK